MVREQLYKGCVVHDFLKTTLQSTDFTIQSAPHRNPALSVEQLAVMLEYQTALQHFPKEIRTTFGRRAGYLLTTGATGVQNTKLHMPKDLAEDVHQTYLADAKALDRTFLSGPVLAEELERTRATAPAARQSILAEDIFDQDSLKILRRNAKAIANLIDFAPESIKESFTAAMNTAVFAG